MPLVCTKEMLTQAQAKNYAVGAFNIENMEMAQAAIAAGEEAGRPIILQTTPGTLRYAPPAVFAAMVEALASCSSQPVAMHLDHGASFEMAEAARNGGYTSIMYDGSLLPFEENVETTRRVVVACADIPVEAELGSVGGKEDDHEANIQYTDPQKAKQLVEQTGVFSLAIAIGTAHGLYSGEPVLDIARLAAIRKLVSIPLVLHGASGLKDDVVRECIREGICKVNFATELRIAYTNGVRGFLAKNPAAIDPKAYGKAGYEAVRQLVLSKITLVSG